jgi:hypothetical protein
MKACPSTIFEFSLKELPLVFIDNADFSKRMSISNARELLSKKLVPSCDRPGRVYQSVLEFCGCSGSLSPEPMSQHLGQVSSVEHCPDPAIKSGKFSFHSAI